MQISNTILLKEIVNEIIDKIEDHSSLQNCEVVCKLWNEVIANRVDYQTEKAIKLMPEIVNFPLDLIDALGGLKKVYQLPILDLLNQEEHFARSFEYINWLSPKDLGCHKICRGIDMYSRPFVTFSYTEFFPRTSEEYQRVCTIFKRRPGSLSETWTSNRGPTGLSPKDFLNDSIDQKKYKLEEYGVDDIKELKTLFLKGEFFYEDELIQVQVHLGVFCKTSTKNIPTTSSWCWLW